MIAADGIHSLVRDISVGPDMPIRRRRIAYRAVFPSALMNGGDIGPSRTKWWGIDRHSETLSSKRGCFSPRRSAWLVLSA